MPLRRKLSRRPDGTYTVFLPKTWIEEHEKELGRKIDHIYMEVDGVINLSPIKEELTRRK